MCQEHESSSVKVVNKSLHSWVYLGNCSATISQFWYWGVQEGFWTCQESILFWGLACFLYISDQGSTYSGDLESEAVSTPHSWEEELNHYALKSNAVQEADSELKQFSKGETEQDLEADFPSGLCRVTCPLKIFYFKTLVQL